MTTSKSTRDYIKNWGRTAARSHKPKTFNCYEGGLHIGSVEVQWSAHENDFVWLASMNFDGQTWQNTCVCESEATSWVHAAYYNVMKSATFGKWLTVMMKRHQMTTAGLAERLGITRQTVHYWVKDERKCTDLSIYHHIAALFADLEQMEHSQMLGHMSLLFKPN